MSSILSLYCSKSLVRLTCLGVKSFAVPCLKHCFLFLSAEIIAVLSLNNYAQQQQQQIHCFINTVYKYYLYTNRDRFILHHLHNGLLPAHAKQKHTHSLLSSHSLSQTGEIRRLNLQICLRIALHTEPEEGNHASGTGKQKYSVSLEESL